MLDKKHWMIKRMLNPIGKLIDDLNYLNFRRYMILALSEKDGKTFVCVHEDCLDKFKNIEFFSIPGIDHNIITVKNKKQAKDYGADAIICGCPKKELPHCFGMFI